MTQSEALARSVAFLEGIGIPCHPSEEARGFLEHIRIDHGTLFYNPTHAKAANLLHEAGHIAVLPSKLRADVGTDLDDTFDRLEGLMDEAFDPENPDSPEVRALLQCGETEATAWAWAAGKAIGLPDALIIEDEDYDNCGADIRLALACNAYLGINGLVAGNMATSVRAYPTLTRWLQI